MSGRVTDDSGLAAEIASGLAGELRARGVTVELYAVLECARALLALGDLGRSAVYWAGRATFTRSPGEFATYDAAFAAYFGTGSDDGQLVRREVHVPVPASEEDGAEPDPDGGGDDPALGERYSSSERLAHPELGGLAPAVRDELAHITQILGRNPASRISRRHERSLSASPTLDLRRTVAELLATDGELIQRRYLRRSREVRRIVLLCDVSGSMESYAPDLLGFAHALLRARPGVEVFAMGTRLTRLTRELGAYDPQVALARAGDAIVDWSGGTRLGEALGEFNERFGLRSAARAATVIICSDGIDRGDPSVIAGEMSRLARVAHRVVWVNPLKLTAGYEPLARGMAAALPFVDEFIGGSTLESLEPLARSLAG